MTGEGLPPKIVELDAWHAVVVFDEHHPLRFTAGQVADYLDTAQEWARMAHQADPAACYPLFLWNCLWRSGASILPSSTPFKETETLIITPKLDRDLKSAIYRVFSTFVEQLGVQSFNLILYQPPLAETPEEWGGFPLVARILNRGNLSRTTSGVGAMEFFAQSVVATDPFRVLDALQSGPQEGTS